MKLKGLLPVFLALYGVMFGGVWSEPEELTSNERGYLAIDNSGICWCMVRYEAYTYQNDEIGWQFEGISPIGWGQRFDKGDTTWWVGEYGFKIHYGKYFHEASWSDTGTVPCYPSFNTDPYMTADSTEGVWVCWWTDWFDYFRIAYNRYQNGEWDEPQTISDPEENCESSTMTTDALGRVWAGWIAFGGGAGNWYYSLKAAYHDDAGWSDEMTIYVTDSLVKAQALKLFPDRESGMWALWSQAGIYDSNYAIFASHWDKDTWSEPETLTTKERNVHGWCWGARGAVDGYGNAWAVWREDVEEDEWGDIYYSVNGGNAWSEPGPVSAAPGTDHQPDIAVDGAGRIWCVWGSVRDGGDWNVYASYTTSAGVAEPVTAPATHHLPSLTIDKSVGREFTFRVSSPDVRGELLIYDAGGRMVRSLAVEGKTVAWDGKGQHEKSLPSGVYFIKLDSNSSEVRKIVLIR